MAPLSFVVASALRDLRRTGAAGVAGVLLTALAALAAGATVLGMEALDRLSAAWRAELRLVLILTDDAARRDGRRTVLPAVHGLSGVASVRYVSPDDALAELRRFLEQDGPAADGLDRLATNPIPARLEVTPGPGVNASGLARLVGQLQSLPGIQTVQAPIGWVEPAERVADGVRRVGLALTALLGLGALLAIGAATGIARQRRAVETAVLRLSGVPEARLRVPLLLQAAAQGGAGAALGLGVLWLLAGGGTPALAAGLRALLGLSPLAWPAWPLGAWLLAGGAGLGLAGGLAAGRP